MDRTKQDVSPIIENELAAVTVMNININQRDFAD